MPARVQPSVLWREGMFLYPQHFQAFSREVHARLSLSAGFGLVGDWGVLELTVDEDALAEDLFQVKTATVVFRDGSQGVFPSTAHVEQREFAEHFTGPTLDVYLGVPAAKVGVAQTGEEGASTRYRVQREEIPDENDRDGRREMEFRQLNAHLFFGDEDRSGFDTVRIARLGRVGSPEARSVLSSSFLPTVLRAGASPVLVSELARLLDKARSQARDLAARMPDVARLGSVDRGTDVQGIFKLQAVNQCVAVLHSLAGQGELHPFDVHRGLLQCAGFLAVFGSGRTVPDLPAYDHANLDAPLRAAIDAVDGLLVAEVAAPYDSTRFEPDAKRPGLFRADVPADWVGRTALFHLAVEMAEDADTVGKMVTSGVKLLPEGDIERVLQGVMPGIELRQERIAPLSFPKMENMHYFAVEVEGEGREAWLGILKSRSAVVLSAISPDEISFQLFVEFPD